MSVRRAQGEPAPHDDGACSAARGPDAVRGAGDEGRGQPAPAAAGAGINGRLPGVGRPLDADGRSPRGCHCLPASWRSAGHSSPGGDTQTRGCSGRCAGQWSDGWPRRRRRPRRVSRYRSQPTERAPLVMTRLMRHRPRCGSRSQCGSHRAVSESALSEMQHDGGRRWGDLPTPSLWTDRLDAPGESITTGTPVRWWCYGVSETTPRVR